MSYSILVLDNPVAGISGSTIQSPCPPGTRQRSSRIGCPINHKTFISSTLCWKNRVVVFDISKKIDNSQTCRERSTSQTCRERSTTVRPVEKDRQVRPVEKDRQEFELSNTLIWLYDFHINLKEKANIDFLNWQDNNI